MIIRELECEDCGTIIDVYPTYCPYAQELEGEEVEAVLCEHCYNDRCNNI